MAEFEISERPARIVKEATLVQTLSAGAKVKAECGEDELSETVPAGKEWATVIVVRVIETDAS